MRELILLLSVSGFFLLTACAGTGSDFECNATTSDTCMTMEQANEKAKKEETGSVKLVVTGSPRLDEDASMPLVVNSNPLPMQSGLTPRSPVAVSLMDHSGPPVHHNAINIRKRECISNMITGASCPGALTGSNALLNESEKYPKPSRTGEQITSLWIAPYVDSDDVYHQPTTIFFVLKPSEWG
ncbi:type IV conjugative transfer system lipoprotein TraV [Klebsiella aerogenes]